VARDKCNEQLLASSDYKTLKDKRVSIVNSCIAKNANWKVCLSKAQLIEQCSNKLNSDANVNREKTNMLNAVNSCYQRGPINPLFVISPRVHAKAAPQKANGRRKRQAQSPCTALLDCVTTAEVALKTDRNLLAVAKRVYDAQNKCRCNNVAPFECVASSQEILTCIKTASEKYNTAKSSTLKTCMNAPQG